MMDNSVIQFRGTIYENGYGLLAQKVMRDKNLPKQSKLIYAYMCSFASVSDEWKRSAFPSVALQCSELGMGEGAYYKWRKPLVEKGYITIEKRKNEEGKFTNNIYYIESVVNPVSDTKKDKEKEEEKKKEQKKKKEKQSVNKEKKDNNNPYFENEGMDKHPYFENESMVNPSMENPSMEKRSTNSNSLNSNSLNSNNNKQYQYQERDVETLKVPLHIKKMLKENLVRVNGIGFDIFDLELFFQSSHLIDGNATKDTIDYLNASEFFNTVRSMIQLVDGPINNTYGLLKSWCLNAISYKRDLFYDNHQPVEEQENLEELDLIDNPIVDRMIEKYTSK